jgi:galactonate dehydratase
MLRIVSDTEVATSPLKIAKIEAFIVDCYRTNWVFAKVTTNEGLYGYGEGSLENRELSVVQAIEELSSLLIGQNPFDIERLNLLMQRESYWRAGPILSTAMSAVEIALWDIKGKALGVPVYQLLGGKVHDRIPIYANSWFAGAKTTEEFREKAAATVAQGFRGLKWDPFGTAYLSLTTAQINHVVANVTAIRETVGPDIDLMVEGHGRLDVSSAIQIGRELAGLGVRWFEEPTLPDRAANTAKVRSAISIPIAAGERTYSRFGCADLIDAQAVDVLQPDVCHVGGLLEMKRISVLADAAGVPIAPHNPYGPVCHAASMHFAASCQNFLVLETFIIDVPWRSDLSNDVCSFEDGCFVVPDRPGLGIELNEHVFAKYPYRPHEFRHYSGKLTDIRPVGSRRWF